MRRFPHIGPPALAALLLAMAAGCVRVPPVDLARDPAALLEQVRASQERIQRVRGSARVRIRSPGGSGAVTEFIAAEKPDRVRLETLDFFGNPAAVLVAAGGRFAFLDRRENVLYRGEASPENVSRLLPVMLPVDELVTIVCGSAPLLAGSPVDVQADGETLLLTLAQGALGQRVAVGARAAVEWSRVRRSEVDAGGGRRETAPAYDLEFGSFRSVPGTRFPEELHLDAPAAQAHVDLEWWNDVEVNGALDPALFRLDTPRGVRVVELGPGATPPPPERPAERPRE